MNQTLRCAVYTRKSSEEGLDQQFNSLDAQREACEAYIKSQAAEGWRLEKKAYDDGGFSGGTMERPALQALLTDIERGLVNVIVVYKIDRLSRSLADFARLVELFDKKNVTFVSVTQHFNTTTSMGRLTLNVLLSFAQFEREITGERIRDKIAASKRKGMWMGGCVPMGYDVKDRKLVVNGAEAEHVRLIYRLYLELGTVNKLAEELHRRNIRSKARVSETGVHSGGCTFLRGQLYILIRNRTYLGEVAHGGSVYPGEHQAIVDRPVWEAAQELLAANRRKNLGTRAGNPKYLLTGLLRDDRGHPMTAYHTNKKGARGYSYYVSQALIRGRPQEAGSVPRVAVREIEAVVEHAMLPILDPAQRTVWQEGPTLERREVLRALVSRVELCSDEVKITLRDRVDSTNVDAQEKTGPDGQVLVLRFVKQRRGGQNQIHLPAGQVEATRVINPSMARAMNRAWKWRHWFDKGEVTSLTHAADRDGCTEAYVRKLLPMAFLAPDIVAATLNGSLPRNLTIADLASHAMPLDWSAQRVRLGMASNPVSPQL